MAKEKPLVTIVTITFNLIKGGREKTFRQCLESVHNQTYRNIEHIIIDGASRDGTVNLIEEYAGKGWIKYISEPDTGIYDAMNKGIKLSKGKYVAFLNSDDFYHNKTGVEKSVKMLEESGADFSYAPAVLLSSDGSVVTNDHPHIFPKISNTFNTMPFCHQTMFTKRETLSVEGMFDTYYKSAADYDLVIRLCLKKYQSVFINEAIVTYRFGGISDINQRQSVEEVARLHFRNYSKLVSITKEDCKKIYYADCSKIPSSLVEVLKNYGPYFDYDDFIKARRQNADSRFFRAVSTLIRSWTQKVYLCYFRGYFKPRRVDVFTAYSCFLGRKPENESAILGHMKQKTVFGLVASFRNSEEFKLRLNQKSGTVYLSNVLIKQIKRLVPLCLKRPIKKLYYSIRS